MEDLGFKGQMHTWSNNQRGDERVVQILSWFGFENMWLEREDCVDVIKAAWSRGGSARTLKDLEPKMEECMRSLVAWSKEHFKHNILETNKARRRLQTLYGSVINEEEEGEERALKSRIDALWKREEIYWRQRLRVKWLEHGYKNTKYFHQTTLARRRRNKILQIRAADEAWVEEEKAVTNEMFAYYNKLFKTEREVQGGGQMWDQTMSSILRQVSREINGIFVGPHRRRK